MKRRLHKIISIICCIALCISINIVATAEYSTEKVIADVGISVPTSDEWIIITKDVEENDRGLQLLGFSYEQAIKYMDLVGLCVFGVHIESGSVLNVLVVDAQQKDFNSCTADELQAKGQELESTYKLFGFGVHFEEYNKHPQTIFLKTSFSKENEQMIQFSTIYNSKSFVCSLHTEKGEISRRTEESLNSFVEGIRFLEASSQKLQTRIFDPLASIMDSGYNPTWDTPLPAVPQNVIQVSVDNFFMTSLTLSGKQCTALFYYDASKEKISDISLQADLDITVIEKALKESVFFDHEEDFYGILTRYYMKDGSKWEWSQSEKNGFTISISLT